LAYSASWHESQKQARETWVRPPQVSEAHVQQSVASFKFDEQMHTYLVDTAPNDREKQRLLRVAQPHASAFVTAVPSDEDGKDTILRPRIYRTAVAYRLGVPVLSNELPCPLCTQHINIYGDHAICCAKSGDLVIRHNTLRNLVNSIASDGLLSPILEKKGILGPTSGRRPGDVTIPNWEQGNGLAIDVAVTSPLQKSSVRLVSPCEEYAANQKHRKYDLSFEGTDYSFCAMVFETLGAVNHEGEEVLQQLFRFAAKRLGREFSSFCGRSWARVSCSLQRSVAQAILNRIDGNFLPLPETKTSVVPEIPSLPLAVPSVGSVPESPIGVVSVGSESVGSLSKATPSSVLSSVGVPPQIPLCPFEHGHSSRAVVRLGGEKEGGGEEMGPLSVCPVSVVYVITPINSLSGWTGRRGYTNRPEYIFHTPTSPPPSQCTLVSVRSPLHTTPHHSHHNTTQKRGEACGTSTIFIDLDEAAYGSQKVGRPAL